jgi:cysteine desulfurase/selenocysteine lyase
VVDAADVERRISPRTRVIVMIHVSSLFGSVEPVEAVGGIAARHGVVFAVDASQAVGRIPFDMARINCDFAALSGRKALLGPQGVGVLVGRNGSLRRLRPLVIGSRSAVLEAVGDGEVRHAMAESPHHLEAGALNTGGIIGLGASVTFLEDLGWTAVFARIHALGRALWNAIAAVPRVEVYGDPEHSPRTGIISFNIEGRTSREVCEELWGLDRVITSPGIHGSPLALNKIGVPGTVRASVHCYNTEDEIQRLARGLEAIVTQRAHPRVSLN